VSNLNQPQIIAPRWLKLKAAVEYCPYGQKKIIELIKEGKIKGGQMSDNKDGWFVDKLSLDQYMDSQCQSDEISQKVVEYCERVS
jgi:hypothetical protein